MENPIYENHTLPPIPDVVPVLVPLAGGCLRPADGLDVRGD
jgi:hypothetical protein